MDRLKRGRWAAAALLLGLAASPAPAQPALPDAPTLDDYLAFAEANSPELAAADQRWSAAREAAAGAGALPDPVLSYGYFFTPVETRVGPQRDRLGLRQSLPWFGTLGLQGEAASAGARAAGARREGVRRGIVRAVKGAYVELAYLHRAIQVTEENVSLLDRLEGVVRSRYRTGAADYSTLIRVQVERGKLQDRLRGLEDRRRPLTAALNASLGRPEGEPLPWPDALPAMEVALDADSLRQRLGADHPELLALAAEVERQRAAESLAGKAGWPSITLSVERIRTDPAVMPDVADSGKDPVVGGIALSLPLWRGKVAAGRREAASRRLAAEASRQDLLNRLDARLESALYDHRDAARKIALYDGELIPQARQSLAATEEAFRAGGAGFDGLVDAERLLLEFRLNLERARADRALALADIEQLTGEPTPRTTP
ncbi:MAG: TolC family protein [Candidatus Krumholzibacteriia bacterium]|nr:TolC family protein [bacterium]MCB9516229.1 TolC family protein [Candidatus Latescibacterota bacterium]